MKLKDFALWAEIISAAAIVAALIFVGLQIQQNTAATTLDLIQANRVLKIENFRAERDSSYITPILVKLNSGEELNEEESRRYFSHLQVQWATSYYEWVQRDLNIGSEYIQNDISIILLDTQEERDFWNFTKRIFPEEFINYIENTIDEP